MATEKRLFDENIPIIKEYFNNRLIRLDDALKAITPENATSLPDNQLVALLTARKKLKSVPIIDAVEVGHGQWEPVDHDGSWRVDMCSICHRRMHYVDYDQPYQYCPNCGAKMDGDGNGIQ